MAYVSQEMKKTLAPAIKSVLKKYGYKGSIAVDNHSSLVVNIKEGVADFIGMANAKNKEIAERRNGRYYPSEGYIQVNTYYPEHYGEAQEFLEELIAAMKGTGWYNNTDAQIDYFDIAYYLDINVGKWDKPYVCTALEEAA
jgi:hypothetical protein